jgi:release factor glutamine methyltransferase
VQIISPAPRRCRFGPLVVHYDEHVLRPRPWTLEQSHWAVELAAAAPPGPIVELCAGAGHVGLAAAVLADRDLIQIEADPHAAHYATQNAARAGWAGRTEIRNQPLQVALPPGEMFELMIADPPYLRTVEVSRWPEDPTSAIDGGADGLELVRACLTVAADHLTATGQLLLQVAGPVQGDQVSSLLRAAGDLRLRERAMRVVDRKRAVVLVGRT